MKLLLSTFAYSLLLSSAAMALVGNAPPASGPTLPDAAWLQGLAAGQNSTYIYGLTSVGTTQATALQLTPGYYSYEIDTSGSGGASGVALPACVQGVETNILNNTAYTFTVYPSIANNGLTGAQDTINNTTSTTITTYSYKDFICGKNGVWIGK